MAKVRKHRAKKPTKCCLKGWVCEDHPNQPWNHRGCKAAGELCKNPQCNKDPDSIFLSADCRVQPGRRTRRLPGGKIKSRKETLTTQGGADPASYCHNQTVFNYDYLL